MNNESNVSTNRQYDCDCIILGAGASGLWCAKTAAARGKTVTIIDHAAKAGRKIRIAGGGKCNFTNLEMHPTDFVSQNPHFCKSALARFSPWHMVEYLSERNIPWEEREHSQLFCTRSANDIVSALMDDCLSSNVAFLFSRNILTVNKADAGYSVTTEQETLTAPKLVLALGGSAWPASGATEFGYSLAKQFGHSIIPPRPALVPFVIHQSGPQTWPLHGLAGISLPVEITTAQRSFVDDMLFTHKGISGPAVLQASCFWKSGEPVRINFLPHHPIEDILDANTKPLVRTVLTRLLPERLANALLNICEVSAAKSGSNNTPIGIADKQVAQLTKQERTILHDTLHMHTVTPKGTEGMRKAEVTAGGVDTASVSSKTMESMLNQGLYITGELLDVTGRLGGYNLHWAWASGNAAGLHM